MSDGGVWGPADAVYRVRPAGLSLPLLSQPALPDVRRGPDCALARAAPRPARPLPCPHYLITVTLPRELRALAFARQALVYSALMRTAAAAIQRLAGDPRYVGGEVGCIAVLHTRTRALLYHPHVHLIVTAGGLFGDHTHWIRPKNPAFLVPVRALSVMVRAKMCAALRRAGVLDHVPPIVWTTPWVVHAQPAGNGERVLDYLARYLFRVAITNSRLEHVDDQRVIFRYRDNRTQEMRRATLSGVEFLHRFLQHVLPQRFTKVRYFGLWSRTRRRDLDHARRLLGVSSGDRVAASALATSDTLPAAPPAAPSCPFCHAGTLTVIALLPRQTYVPP